MATLHRAYELFYGQGLWIRQRNLDAYSCRYRWKLRFLGAIIMD